MSGQKVNLDLIRGLLTKLLQVIDLIRRPLTELLRMIDLVEAEKQHNTIQDNRLLKHDSLLYQQQTNIDRMKEENKEIMQKFNSFEAKFNDLLTNILPQIDYLRDKNQELECLSNSYSQDGEAICNSEYNYD